MIVTFVRRVAGALPTADIRRDVRHMAAVLRSARWARDLRHLTLVVVSTGESRRLKRRYLKRAGAANVLAFRYNGAGEIILAPAVIRREAREAGDAYRATLRRMVVHGFLHLAGHHHEASTRAARRFERTERLVLKRLAIAPLGRPRYNGE